MMKQKIFAGLFSAFAILGLGLISEYSSVPMVMTPFGASCLLLFGVPEGPFSKPKNLVFGYLISTLIALVFLHFTSGSLIMMAIAVGVSVFAMLVTETTHPPAAGVPILVLTYHPAWSFLFFPALAGVVVLLVFSFAYQKVLKFSNCPP